MKLMGESSSSVNCLFEHFLFYFFSVASFAIARMLVSPWIIIIITMIIIIIIINFTIKPTLIAVVVSVVTRHPPASCR